MLRAAPLPALGDLASVAVSAPAPVTAIHSTHSTARRVADTFLDPSGSFGGLPWPRAAASRPQPERDTPEI